MTIDFCIAMGWQGGVETVVNRTAGYMRERGYHVRVIQLISRGMEWADPEIEFHCLNGWITEIDWDVLQDSLRTFYETHRFPDLVMATGWPAMTLLLRGVMEEKYRTCPLISWPHGTLSEYEKDGVGGAECCRVADAAFAISDSIAENLRQVCPDTEVIRVHNPVLEEKIIYSEQRNTGELAFVGRISKEKNVPYLLRSLAAAEGDWTLTVAGDGEVKEMQHLSQELGIADRVSFSGWLENPWETLQNACALVMPSLHEGFSLTIIEALACGLTVLSTPVGGAVEVIREGENGYFFGADTGISLTERLNRLYEGTDRLADSKNCRKSAELYLESRAIPDFIRKMELLLQGGRS